MSLLFIFYLLTPELNKITVEKLQFFYICFGLAGVLDLIWLWSISGVRYLKFEIRYSIFLGEFVMVYRNGGTQRMT